MRTLVWCPSHGRWGVYTCTRSTAMPLLSSTSHLQPSTECFTAVLTIVTRVLEVLVPCSTVCTVPCARHELIHHTCTRVRRLPRKPAAAQARPTQGAVERTSTPALALSMLKKQKLVSYNTRKRTPHTVARAIVIVATGGDEGDCSRGVAGRRSFVLRGNDTLAGVAYLGRRCLAVSARNVLRLFVHFLSGQVTAVFVFSRRAVFRVGIF